MSPRTTPSIRLAAVTTGFAALLASAPAWADPPAPAPTTSAAPAPTTAAAPAPQGQPAPPAAQAQEQAPKATETPAQSPPAPRTTGARRRWEDPTPAVLPDEGQSYVGKRRTGWALLALGSVMTAAPITLLANDCSDDFIPTACWIAVGATAATAGAHLAVGAALLGMGIRLERERGPQAIPAVSVGAGSLQATWTF